MPLLLENYIAIARNAPEIQSFMAEWRLDQQTGGGDFDLDYRLRQWCENYPDSAISLLISLAEQSAGPSEKTAIAEGLEWFIKRHGKTYWDVLNALCLNFSSFREVMASVWGADLPKDLKRKIEMWQT